MQYATNADLNAYGPEYEDEEEKSSTVDKKMPPQIQHQLAYDISKLPKKAAVVINSRPGKRPIKRTPKMESYT